MLAETITSRLQRRERGQLAVAQLAGEFGLQHRIRAGRAAAQVRVGRRDADVEAERTQVLLDAAAQLLAVLQRARRVEGELPGVTAVQAVLELRHEVGQQLAQVARQRGDAARLLGIGGVVRERVAVLLDGDAAARGVHHDRLDLPLVGQAFDERPPGVDVAAHVGQAAVAVVQVGADRAAAAGIVGDQGLDAGGVEHARGRAVDVRQHRRLHAAHQQQHLARVLARRPAVRGGASARRHLVLERRRQQRPHELAELHRRAEQRRGQALLQQPAHRLLAGRAFDALLDDLAADVDQVPVLHARRAGGLAIAAGQATVQVQLRAARDRGAFEHLLHQVDAAARPVEFVAEQLVGRAGRGAEAAVHALAQDRFGLCAGGRVLELGGERGLHGVGGSGSGQSGEQGGRWITA